MTALPDRPPSDRELADALAAGTVLLELPYRGHRAQIVATAHGVFGRRDVFGCFVEIGVHNLRQWTRLDSPEAGVAWCHSALAEILYRTTPAGVSRHHAVWHGDGWSAEIDLDRQRYTVATGKSPTATYNLLEARESADEPLAVVEARGWAWLLQQVPISVPDWPRTMAEEYLRRVLLADVR